MAPISKVIIVGAGPSGLLLALLLSQHKSPIPVEIFEAASALDSQPRAAHYGPPAMPELRRAGILDEVRRRGLTLNSMTWRDPVTFKRMARMRGETLADVDGKDERTTCLVLQELTKLMMDKFVAAGGKVRFNTKVKGIGEEDGRAWVDVEGGDREEADWVVGCDGANSAVRKGLFGDEYPGYTWEDKQIVATNTYYDFRKFGWDDANFIIHPQHFFMAAIIQDDGLYRITYGEEPGLSQEQLRERLAWKFKAMLPGNPEPDQYKVVNFSPYRMHQRCAPKFRVGRFLLAADAAHLCSGFVDVGGLYDCLAGIHDGVADDSILDLYSDIRIKKWKEVIDPISTENFKRVFDADPATRFERDEFMQLLDKGEQDDAFAKQLMLGSFSVQHDFTQYYKTSQSVGPAKLTETENAVAGVPQPVS